MAAEGRKLLSKKEPSTPAFLRKTYHMVSTPEYSEFIRWGRDGDTIVIHKVAKFSSEVLPQFFKHSNYASFVRQLNMYGFHKVSPDPACREFKHPLFKKSHPELLAQIKRKVPSSNANAVNGGQHTDTQDPSELRDNRQALDHVLDEMVSLKQRYRDLGKELHVLQQDNEDVKAENSQLWNDLRRSQVRQDYMRTKMQKLMFVLYEMYRALNAARQAPHNRITQPELLRIADVANDSSRETTPEDLSVVRQLFMSDGLLGPEQFARVLDYLRVDPASVDQSSHVNEFHASEQNQHARPMIQDITQHMHVSAPMIGSPTLAPSTVHNPAPATHAGHTSALDTDRSTSPTSIRSFGSSIFREEANSSNAARHHQDHTWQPNQLSESYDLSKIHERSRSSSPGRSSSGSDDMAKHYSVRPLKRARQNKRRSLDQSKRFRKLTQQRADAGQNAVPIPPASLPTLSSEQENLADAEHVAMSNLYNIDYALQSRYPCHYNAANSAANMSAINDVHSTSLNYDHPDHLGPLMDHSPKAPSVASWGDFGEGEFGLTDMTTGSDSTT